MVTCSFTVFLVLLSYCTLSEAKQPIEERWSDEVTGEVVLEDLTPQQARNLCLARAKARAVEQVAGVKVLSETLAKDFMLVADLVSAQSQAWVKEVKEERWESQTVQKRTDEPPQVLYRVRLKGLVAVDRDRDEGFAVKLLLNRSSYETGDEMQITVQSGQDAYLTIFNIIEDDRVTILLPNRFKMDRMAKKGEKVRFPDPESMGSSRKLKLFASSKSATAREAILVVATKDDTDLIEGDFSEAAFLEFPKQTGLFQNVLEKLMEIPPSKRAMAVQYYQLNMNLRH
jgi:hypothetical protein